MAIDYQLTFATTATLDDMASVLDDFELQNVDRVTPVIDRYYFRPICCREPGGVFFEIATDEDPARLGERLALPPFVEPRRREIEAGLWPLPPVEALVAR